MRACSAAGTGRSSSATGRPTELVRLGIDLDALARQRRPLVRGCLDWSERELHVAGAFGAALAARLFELGWVRRYDTSRAVELTDEGRRLLRKELGVT